MTRYYVSSPPKDRRSRRLWVNTEEMVTPEVAIGLADWSYGMTYYDTLEEARAIGRQAKEAYPKRRFRIELDLDGNAYETVEEV